MSAFVWKWEEMVRRGRKSGFPYLSYLVLIFLARWQGKRRDPALEMEQQVLSQAFRDDRAADFLNKMRVSEIRGLLGEENEFAREESEFARPPRREERRAQRRSQQDLTEKWGIISLTNVL